MSAPLDIAASHRDRIGCSQIAQALGMSRWGTAYDLWAVYAGERQPDDIGDELRVALGEPMEEVLRPFVAARLGRELRRDRREYLHPSLPLIGHVDYRAGRIDGESARPVVDMKTSLGFGARHRFGADETDEVDDDVLLQMHGYLMLTGAERAYVAALVPGPELKIYTIERDPEMLELIAEGIERFWTLVQSGTPPDPTSEAEARQRWRWHQAGRSVELDDTSAANLRRLTALKAEIAEREREAQAIKDALIPALADAETIMHAGRILATFRANKPSIQTNWAGLARSLMGELGMDEPARIAWQNDYTEIQPGARVLRPAKEMF